MFSAVVVPSGLPTHSVGGLPFTHLLPCMCFWLAVNEDPSDWCEVGPRSTCDVPFANSQGC